MRPRAFASGGRGGRRAGACSLAPARRLVASTLQSLVCLPLSKPASPVWRAWGDPYVATVHVASSLPPVASWWDTTTHVGGREVTEELPLARVSMPRRAEPGPYGVGGSGVGPVVWPTVEVELVPEVDMLSLGLGGPGSNVVVPKVFGPSQVALDLGGVQSVPIADVVARAAAPYLGLMWVPKGATSLMLGFSASLSDARRRQSLPRSV